MNKPIALFVEGPDLSGKDTFIDRLLSLLHVFVFYPSGRNFFDYPSYVSSFSWKISYSLIADSILKNNQPNVINIIYRSPFTDYIYNKVYNRNKVFEFDDYIKFMKNNYLTNIDTELLFIMPEYEQLYERYLIRGDKNLKFTIDQLKYITSEYSSVINKIKEKLPNTNIITLQNTNDFFTKFDDHILEVIKPNVKYDMITLVDIDGTLDKIQSILQQFNSVIYFTGRLNNAGFEKENIFYNNLNMIKSSRIYKATVLGLLLNSKRIESIQIFEDRKDIIDILIGVALKNNYTISLSRINDVYLLSLRLCKCM